MTREMPDGPPDPARVVQLKVHGGLGDLLWVYKKFHTYADPLFLHIANENRARPRRSGILADHLPNVAGWRFDETTFAPGGQDWGPPTDPASALGKTWADVRPRPGQVLRLECNRHLEGGRRLETWLPDLPTTHHFTFRPPADQPRVVRKTPYVILHLAGWPDVPDGVWIRAADVFAGYAHVYVVGGSYDFRPARLAEALRGRAWVTLLLDLPWADLHALLAGAAYCFGHASGFTALADVLRVPGVVSNPQQHPRLVGTWNSPDNPAQVHCRAGEFEGYVFAAYQALAAGGPGAWPPGSAALPRVSSPAPTVGAAVRALAAAFRPATITVLSGPGAPADLAAAALHGALDAGRLPVSLGLAAATADQVTALYTAAARTTRPPAMTLSERPPTGEPAELAVVWVAGTPAEAVERARAGWRRTSPRGVLVLSGPEAGVAARTLGGTIKVDPVEVRDAPGVYYVGRRV